MLNLRRLPAVLLAGFVAGLVLGMPATAAAHTELKSSNPAAGVTLDAAPATVELTFTQPVQAEFAQVAVLDAAQAHFESGAASVAGEVVSQAVTALPAGAYTVSWRVVAADGHPVTGTYAFSIAAPRPPRPRRHRQPLLRRTRRPRPIAATSDDDAGMPAWATAGIALGAAGAVGAVVILLVRGSRNPAP